MGLPDNQKPHQSLAVVVIVAMVAMMSVLIVGSAYDKMSPPKTYIVPCSVSIHNMARKLNITLLGECEVDE